MKRLLVFATMIFAFGPLMLGQNKSNWDPKLHPKRKDATTAKDPLASGTKHHATIPDMSGNSAAKPKGVDAQLKQLEAQDVRQSAPKASSGTSRKTALPAATAGNKTAGSGMDFKYQAPKGGSKASNKSSGTGVTGTGVKRRVKGR